MFGLSGSLFLITSLIWVIGAPIAFILAAIFFARFNQPLRESITKPARTKTEFQQSLE